MQVIKYERWDENLFCPVTGTAVFNETGEPQAPTVRGVWVADVVDEPTSLHDDLQQTWERYVARPEVEEDGIDMDTFLGSVQEEGWVAFRVTSNGFACGPVSQTIWVVLDLQLELEADE